MYFAISLNHYKENVITSLRDRKAALSFVNNPKNNIVEVYRMPRRYRMNLRDIYTVNDLVKRIVTDGTPMRYKEVYMDVN